MRLAVLLVADYANVTNNGKLNVMGIFNDINAQKFPARHSSMQVVISLMPELGELQQDRELNVKLIDDEGKSIVDISGPLQVPGLQNGLRPQINAILEIKDVVFHKPGRYEIVILVDKDQKGEYVINVNKSP